MLHEWCDAQQRLRVLFADESERVFELGAEPHEVEVDANPEWSSRTFRYRYQSLTTPLTIYEEDVVTGERTTLKQTPVPNVDLSKYTATREWATSEDGTQVPVDLVRHIDTPIDGTAPCVIYGYGSYEASKPPWFSAARLSLLDRGVRVGAGASPWRRRAGPPLVPRRQAPQQAQHVRRHDRGDRAPRRRSAGPRPTAWPSAAAAPGACWSGRA